MKPAPFAYHRPTTVEEAVDLLAEHGPEARIIAGGQSLVPMMNLRMSKPSVLIDVNRISALGGWKSHGDVVRTGATLRQSAFERDASLAASLPLLREAVRHVGHVATRARGTVGGSLCHADPAAELPVCAQALDAVIVARSKRGVRRVEAQDFFRGVFTTALDEDEMVEVIEWPVPSASHRFAFVEVARRHGDFAIVSVACRLDMSAEGHIADARLAVGGAAAAPARLSEVEAKLCGKPASGKTLEEVAALAREALSPSDDIHATAEYRKDLMAVLVRRAIVAAAGQTVAMEQP